MLVPHFLDVVAVAQQMRIGHAGPAGALHPGHKREEADAPPELGLAIRWPCCAHKLAWKIEIKI
jgi:hypothetical protein